MKRRNLLIGSLGVPVLPFVASGCSGSDAENPYLMGNYGPVPGESTFTELQVTGQIPEELTGRFLRNGPNPVGVDPSSHHWFVGRGMVHGVRLDGGRAPRPNIWNVTAQEFFQWED